MERKIEFFIIDDSELNLYYTEDLLTELDFVGSITTYTEAKEGLKEMKLRLKNNLKLPDVILLDIRMPGMDGFEFLEELDDYIEETLETKVFILTSSNHKRDVESYDKQHIACEFMEKPLGKELIEERIKFYFY